MTILISLFTKAPEESTLRGLVYSLTERVTAHEGSWYSRPEVLAIGVCAIALALNIYFF